MYIGKINIVVSDELEQQFREAVFKKAGMRKGNISKAVAEALQMYIRRTQATAELAKDILATDQLINSLSEQASKIVVKDIPKDEIWEEFIEEKQTDEWQPKDETHAS